MRLGDRHEGQNALGATPRHRGSLPASFIPDALLPSSAYTAGDESISLDIVPFPVVFPIHSLRRRPGSGTSARPATMTAASFSSRSITSYRGATATVSAVPVPAGFASGGTITEAVAMGWTNSFPDTKSVSGIEKEHALVLEMETTLKELVQAGLEGTLPGAYAGRRARKAKEALGFIADLTGLDENRIHQARYRKTKTIRTSLSDPIRALAARVRSDVASAAGEQERAARQAGENFEAMRERFDRLEAQLASLASRDDPKRPVRLCNGHHGNRAMAGAEDRAPRLID